MTRLLYLEDAAAWRCESRLTAVEITEGGIDVELDSTPFYPRGGGQPSDTGTLIAPAGRMAVGRVARAPDGSVVHSGTMVEGIFFVGDPVVAAIDVDARMRNSRLHTAGELICAAVAELGHCWQVTAASHIPGQSRVAFATGLNPGEVPGLMSDLRRLFGQLVARDEPVLTRLDVPPDEARGLCAMDAHSMGQKRGPIRLVSPVRGFFRPCMGAHTRSTGEVGAIVFKKARLRDGQLSITYELG